MSSDPFTVLIRNLNQAVLTLATIGGSLHLSQSGASADPAVAQAMSAVLDAVGAPRPDTLSPDERRQALGLIRTFFVEANDLFDDPAREPGWSFRDHRILQGIGDSSAGMVGRIAGLAKTRPWLDAVLARPGTLLDIGTGVGGLALAAARAWPALDVVGIDRWAPSLELAEQNRTADAVGARVCFENRPLEAVDDVERFACAWLPTPFIAAPVVREALPRLYRALRPGGALIAGVMPPPPERLGAALGHLRTVRNGGAAWTCDAMAGLLQAAGMMDVEVPSGQAGMQFVIARRG